MSARDVFAVVRNGRVILVALAAVWIAGCQDLPPPAPDAGARSTTAAAPRTAPDVPADAASATHAAERDVARDAGGTSSAGGDGAIALPGATLRELPGGSIRLEAHDRWGGDASATFESTAYLARALPALARTLAPETVAALRAWVQAPWPHERHVEWRDALRRTKPRRAALFCKLPAWTSTPTSHAPATRARARPPSRP